MRTAIRSTNGTPSVEAPKAWIELSTPLLHEERAHDRERPRREHERYVPHLEHPAFLLDHQRVQEGGAGQPRHQRRVLDGVPAPVAAPPELRVGPARTQQDAYAEQQPGREGEAPDSFDPVGVESSRQQRADTERERDRRERVARVEHRRVDHHRREAQERIESRAFRRGRPGGGERVGVEEHQRDEEPAEAEQDRGRVGGDLAHPLTDEEKREARPHRQQPGPQQQRAFLRGPHGGCPVEPGRRPARRVGDRVEREVVAQERELEHGHRHGEDAGERVHRATRRLRVLDAPAAHAVDRRAGAVRAHAEREHEACVAEARHQRLEPRTIVSAAGGTQ